MPLGKGKGTGTLRTPLCLFDSAWKFVKFCLNTLGRWQVARHPPVMKWMNDFSQNRGQFWSGWSLPAGWRMRFPVCFLPSHRNKAFWAQSHDGRFIGLWLLCAGTRDDRVGVVRRERKNRKKRREWYSKNMSYCVFITWEWAELTVLA